MSEELKCPFLIQEDWSNDFDGPCAVVKGNRCEVHQQLAKRDARIAELEREIKFLKTEMTCWDSYIKELEKKVSGNE